MLEWLAAILAGLLALGSVVVCGKYYALWLRCFVTGAQVSLLSLILMSLRTVSPRAIVDAKIMTVQVGLTHNSTNALEAHYLAGGNIDRVVLAEAEIPIALSNAFRIGNLGDRNGRVLLPRNRTSGDGFARFSAPAPAPLSTS
jgi:uncharacterized protein YqfA (UPF0365 family)